MISAVKLGLDGRTIELVDAAPILFKALRSDHLDAEGRAVIDAVEAADVLVADRRSTGRRIQAPSSIFSILSTTAHLPESASFSLPQAAHRCTV